MKAKKKKWRNKKPVKITWVTSWVPISISESSSKGVCIPRTAMVCSDSIRRQSRTRKRENQINHVFIKRTKMITNTQNSKKTESFDSVTVSTSKPRLDAKGFAECLRWRASNSSTLEVEFSQETRKLNQKIMMEKIIYQDRSKIVSKTIKLDFDRNELSNSKWYLTKKIIQIGKQILHESFEIIHIQWYVRERTNI